jgi:hypothetical protein
MQLEFHHGLLAQRGPSQLNSWSVRRYADLFFELLILRGSQAVALVTTGNATFATGPRQALLDWLRSCEQGLRPR